MADANIHPSVILIRDRLHDIFPEIEIPLDIIGWHIRQSTSIEAICSHFVSEILSFGQVTDPRQTTNDIQEQIISSSSCTPKQTTINDDTLKTLYDVFNTIPHDYIENIYIQFKNSNNPNWYDDIVNELLSYNLIKPSINKRSYDDMIIDDIIFIPDEYNRLLAILPDIDPDYALECYMRYRETSSDKTDLNILITSLIENGYIKLIDKLERLHNERLKENLREPKFEINEFLKTFPNPLEYFYDRTKNLSESYKKHAYIYLANAFARVSIDYIKQILSNNNYRFAPSIKQLQEEFQTYHINQNKQGKKSNDAVLKRLNQRARAPVSIPDIPDEIFYKELCYVKHEDEIIEIIMSSKDIDTASVNDFDPNRALGLWHILATNLDMWKDKLTPTITYSIHDQLPDGRLRLNDLVEYYTRRPFRGFVPTDIRGIDTQSISKSSRFQWRGNGLLKLFTSEFGIIFVDNETPIDQPYQWIGTMFSSTLFTNAGVDLMTRTQYLTRKQEFRDEQIRIATENGTLQTCDCCCDDQLLDDDMISCDNNHRFCQTCIRNYIENGFISNGECFFTCLNSTCKYEYSTSLMNHLLSPTLLSRLLIKIQQEELRLANIPNFEQCKYCTFGTIIDDPNERVFRCLNQECLKETCRACGEPNHIPLRCDEVEKKDELDMRTFIENRVSEAMIRVCYKCKQRFYKLEGCNKMTCACGASMCYICRQPIHGYEHFNNNEKCGANTDVVKLHQEEMHLAYEEAKKVYIERHPETRDLVLKYDPQQHLAGSKPKNTSKRKRGRHRYE
ncbi:unnamed protein product [Rotaria sordida]|uniref:RING-type domain-containing protein n=1 Tax=Rotaria sordida TaxID=392033 RepID=A0A819BM50_9BILA|nr:unnamed protein product [Rotaria sordida]CAF3800451.1 unnamed protein product [Rotaria sordida]